MNNRVITKCPSSRIVRITVNKRCFINKIRMCVDESKILIPSNFYFSRAIISVVLLIVDYTQKNGGLRCLVSRLLSGILCFVLCDLCHLKVEN